MLYYACGAVECNSAQSDSFISIVDVHVHVWMYVCCVSASRVDSSVELSLPRQISVARERVSMCGALSSVACVSVDVRCGESSVCVGSLGHLGNYDREV